MKSLSTGVELTALIVRFSDARVKNNEVREVLFESSDFIQSEDVYKRDSSHNINVCVCVKWIRNEIFFPFPQ